VKPSTRWPLMVGLPLLLASSWLTVACRCNDDSLNPKPAPTSSAGGAAQAATAPQPTLVAVSPASPLVVRSGSCLALTPDEKLLLLANEDAATLQLVPLPLGSAAVRDVPLPGRPAQLVTDGSSVWVTLRDPSVLWVGALDAAGVSEQARIPLPNDAWGLALSADKQRAVVTSAWAAQVSLIDLSARRVLSKLGVGREPRGVVIDNAGKTAWVTHLVGSAITELSLGDTLESTPVELPAAPLRAPPDGSGSSLGYAGVLAPDESRYFAARHALGALGKNTFFGAATLDVLLLPTRKPALQQRRAERKAAKSQLASQLISGNDTSTPGSSLTPFTQPRAMLYRSSTHTLLVAGEGDDRIAELDALAPDPTLAVISEYLVAENYHPQIHVAARCAAPTGLALSHDEGTLWVYCRATNDLAEIELDRAGTTAPLSPVRARLPLGEDSLGPGGATGRKLFYSALEPLVSGGLACAGCHPEGRDDGHTWREATFTTEDGEATNLVAHALNIPPEAHSLGHARRTPMLAGRVNAEGPYGWHAESPTLTDRVTRGFRLHRWGGVPEHEPEPAAVRARALADFLRRGLVPPARSSSTLTEQERRGRTVFFDGVVGCAACHQPETGYTARDTYVLPARPLRPGFDADPVLLFKTPALRYLSQRAPYFHDGSAASLEELVETNQARMGDTRSLSADQKADLVAFLRTL
jgi:DNA-binding beta-propeller fold protein YncE